MACTHVVCELDLIIRWQRAFREASALLHLQAVDQILHRVKEQQQLVLRALNALALQSIYLVRFNQGHALIEQPLARLHMLELESHWVATRREIALFP